MFCLISYDIIEDKNRDKVSDILLNYGKRVQYSVFECILTSDYLENLISKLESIIDQGDSIRIYQICQGCMKNIKILGAGTITQDQNVIIL